ncbi:MAG: ribose 5-phosphate isomerase B [Alphaproteobacteria bacterium]|nr:ribose 5-phosphate isomerase B [Alphaproteobacteria bacterium]
MASERIAVAADHAGYPMKAALVEALGALGYEVVDLGTDGPDSVDYPDFADRLATALADGAAPRGVLVCGTGIGISIAANRHRNVRAALCRDMTDARLCRQHNDANVLVLGARTTGIETAPDCLKTFLTTEFEGGRHQRRVDKMS